MILGFAHLALGALDCEATAAAWAARGWALAEAHQDVPSAKEKLPLLSREPERHDLVLLRGSPALEVVAHATGTVAGRSRIALDPDDRGLWVAARDVAAEIAFFRDGLGFAEGEAGRLSLTSRFAQWSIALAVVEDAEAPLDPPLDLAGFTCMAFYSTDPGADGERLAAHGGRDLTAPFAVELNGRRMAVLMLRSPEGTIVELIKVNGRS